MQRLNLSARGGTYHVVGGITGQLVTSFGALQSPTAEPAVRLRVGGQGASVTRRGREAQAIDKSLKRLTKWQSEAKAFAQQARWAAVPTLRPNLATAARPRPRHF